ncbi:MAG TPA: YncE family protein [Verrucomicrobiales bacterium]|nr:YncE family protein [Verrucomicrobiales bacterium]HIL69742.1 YncE family protein [Verrucomicrobiota bacterium]
MKIKQLHSTTILVLSLSFTGIAPAQLIISGNENKIDLASGSPVVVADAVPDSLTLIHFSQFPPRVTHLENIENTVIGPPSNIAIAPDGKLALIANSLKLDSSSPQGYVPNNKIHILDLEKSPPEVIGNVEAEKQPSGISISKGGTFALTANRASGTVSLFSIDGKSVKPAGSIKVCEPSDSASDVAISPDGTFALVSIQEGGYLAVIHINNSKMTLSEQKLSVFGKPYRCIISPDGRFGLTAGSGNGAYPDTDALTIVDLQADPIRVVDYIAIGSGPESIEISPDGNLIAAVLMNGSNLPDGHPHRTENGQITLLAKRENTFEVVQRLHTGRIPEGVAFSSDGKHLLVQCHPAREIQVFEVRGESIRDTTYRIKTPGMPSSIRASGY